MKPAAHRNAKRHLVLRVTFVVCGLGLALPSAKADSQTDTTSATPGEGRSTGLRLASASPPLYSLPWQLRPIAPVTAIRLDNAVGFYKDPATGARGATFVSFLAGAYKIIPEFSALVRLGWVGSDPPTGRAAAGPLDVAVGGVCGVQLPRGLKLGLFANIVLPTAIGSGNSPDAQATAALRSGGAVRSFLDGSMFAANDVTLIPGIDLAYVAHGLTVQVETTLYQYLRVRGKDAQPDSSRTNFSTGLHLGYFFIPEMSVGGDVRYQRWLSTPAAVKTDPTARDALSFALGMRAHIKLGRGVVFHPGLAYARIIDKPSSRADYNMIQVDLPFVF